MPRLRPRRRAKPGLPPGAYVPTLDQVLTEGRLEIALFDYGETGVERRPDTPIEDLVPPPGGVHRWIRVLGIPTRPLLEQLERSFGIHPLILEDLVSATQRIKVEDYDDLMFTILRLDGEYDLAMILVGATLITIAEIPVATTFEPIEQRLDNPASLLRTRGIDFLYHAIVDLVVDRMYPLIERLEDQAAELETAILDGVHHSHLAGIHRLRVASQAIRSTLWATRDIVSRIERSTHRFLTADTLFYFRDIHDHVVHQIDSIVMLRDTASSLMELYMSGMSNRMNEVMKVLTVISTTFIPLTFIAGIYGMNFAYMPELAQRWGYPAVLGVMAVIAGGMLIFFKRKRWF